MPLRRWNTHVYHRRLYAGQLERIILLKRNDDQAEGTVTQHIIYQSRRGNIEKSGEAINLDVPAFEVVSWHIPCTELRRVGVNYLNVLDRIVDQFNMWWQPESGDNIELAIFDNYYNISTRRVDPFPTFVLLGQPGVNLGLPQP